MTVSDFIKAMRTKPDEFLGMWLGEHVKNPEDWPLNQPEVEWDEQFRLWLEEQQA